MNDWVKLDVGGTKFKTTRGTLTSAPESLLAKMFDPDSERPPAALSEDGYYLIDACPRAFAIILNWLRYESKGCHSSGRILWSSRTLSEIGSFEESSY